MTERTSEGKTGLGRFWAAGLCAAVLVHVAGLVLFRVDGEEVAREEADYSFANLPALEGGEFDTELLREQSILQDSAPLFLPTRWNSAAFPAVQALEQRPPELFDLFPARFSYGEADFGQGAIKMSEPALNVTTVGAMEVRRRIPFGRVDAEIPELAERFAVVEVARAGGEALVYSETVGMDGAPAAGQLWAPVEFLAHVENIGRVGELVLLRGSGVDEIDRFLREAVLAMLQERMLETGYYRVTSGP